MASRALKNSGRSKGVPKVMNSVIPPVGAYCKGDTAKHIKNSVATKGVGSKGIKVRNAVASN
jgi:hypothetical protein